MREPYDYPHPNHNPTPRQYQYYYYYQSVCSEEETHQCSVQRAVYAQ
jgi:hypothetical protein